MKKVNLGKKLFHMANALAHGNRPKRYHCRFMAPGLTNYPGEQGIGDEMWYISREVMDKMQESFVGCPVVAQDKHDGATTPDNFEERIKNGDYDGVVSKVWTAEDGWDHAEYIVWNPDVQATIESQGYNVSCAYNTNAYDPGGVLNAINYDHEVTEAEYIHLAVVDAPRQTGSRNFLNSLDSDEAGVIEFDHEWNGTMTKLKLHPNGRKMVNADDAQIESYLDDAIASKKPLQDIVKELKAKGVSESGIQTAIQEAMAKRKSVTNSYEKELANSEVSKVKGLLEALDLNPDDFKEVKTVKQLAAELGWTVQDLTDPMGLRIKKNALKNAIAVELMKTLKKNAAWDGFKTIAEENAADYLGQGKSEEETFKLMREEEKHKSISDDQLKKDIKRAKGSLTNKNKEDEMKKNEIDLEKAVISTPNGDVPLKDMINAYKKNQDEEKATAKEEAYLQKLEDIVQGSSGKKAEEAQAKIDKILFPSSQKNQDEEKKVNMDDEIDGVKVSAMFEAYKKNEDADAAKKKEDEDAVAKKNGDRKAALKSEGKTDEEVESIMKSESEKEAEEKKKIDEESDLKNAEADAKSAKEKADEKVNHFNSLKKAQDDYKGDKPTLKPRMSRVARINSAKKEY